MSILDRFIKLITSEPRPRSYRHIDGETGAMIIEAERPLTASEISERYTYHAPTPEQIKKYSSLRNRAKEYAFMIVELCPESEERTHALHYLDMVVMNANASIARSAPEGIARHSK